MITIPQAEIDKTFKGYSRSTDESLDPTKQEVKLKQQNTVITFWYEPVDVEYLV